MKVTLEFNLDEEKEEYEDAFNGRRYSVCLYNLSMRLRQYRKYGIPEDIKTPEDMLEKIHSDFLEVCIDLPSMP